MYTEDGVLRDDKEIVCDDLFWSGAYDGVISNPRFAVPAPEGMRNMGVATQRIGTAGVGLLAGRQVNLALRVSCFWLTFQHGRSAWGLSPPHVKEQ
jgi:hypothetical protein